MEWRPVEGTKGFIEVSDEGQVRSLLTGKPRILKTQKDKKGYHRVRVTIERQKMSFKLHREVAKAFIPNPYSKPQVNHKDGNKDNNNISNLEWVTNKENAHHAIANGLWDSVFEGARRENESRMKPVVGYHDGETRHFKSVREAEKFIGSGHLQLVLKGKRDHVKGWHFEYAERGEGCAKLDNC